MMDNQWYTMQIKKIISGGQTGADQAALDVAIEMSIPHGGWVPKGRKTEKGRLPDGYNVRETEAIDYDQRTELNVVDSDATLILSKGQLEGGSALTQQLARKHHKPCLVIDLDELSEYKAVEIIRSWLDVRKIEVLNVAGPRESENPGIYENVKDLLKSVLYPPPQRITQHLPQTIDEAVDRLIMIIPFKEKAAFARLDESELKFPPPTLWRYILDKFGLNSGNEKLLNSCMMMARRELISGDEAASVIIKEFWKKLRESYRLRVIK
jgi:hypothetical protein